MGEETVPLPDSEIRAEIEKHPQLFRKCVSAARGDAGIAWEALLMVGRAYRSGVKGRRSGKVATLFSWLYAWGPKRARRLRLGGHTTTRYLNERYIKWFQEFEEGSFDVLQPEEPESEFEEEEFVALRRAFACLRAKDRQLLRERFFEGKTFPEIARGRYSSQRAHQLTTDALRRLAGRYIAVRRNGRNKTRPNQNPDPGGRSV